MPLLLFPAVYIPSQARIISQGHTYWTLVEQTAQEAYIRMAISFLREIVYSYLYFPRFLISTHNRIYNTVVQHYTEAALWHSSTLVGSLGILETSTISNIFFALPSCCGCRWFVFFYWSTGLHPLNIALNTTSDFHGTLPGSIIRYTSGTNPRATTLSSQPYWRVLAYDKNIPQKWNLRVKLHHP